MSVTDFPTSTHAATLHAFLERAQAHLQAGRANDALAVTAHLLATFPDAVRVWRTRAAALAAAGRADEAAAAWMHVLDVTPDDAAALDGCAHALRAAGRAMEAAELSRQALDYAPSDIEWLTSHPSGQQGPVDDDDAGTSRIAVARNQFAAGLTNRAVAHVRGILEAQPTRPDALAVLIDLLWNSGVRHVTAELCRNLLAAHPNCLAAHAILAAYGQRTGDVALQRIHSAAVDAFDPDHRETVSRLGNVTLFTIHDLTLGSDPDQSSTIAADLPNSADSQDKRSIDEVDDLSISETSENIAGSSTPATRASTSDLGAAVADESEDELDVEPEPASPDDDEDSHDDAPPLAEPALAAAEPAVQTDDAPIDDEDIDDDVPPLAEPARPAWVDVIVADSENGVTPKISNETHELADELDVLDEPEVAATTHTSVALDWSPADIDEFGGESDESSVRLIHPVLAADDTPVNQPESPNTAAAESSTSKLPAAEFPAPPRPKPAARVLTDEGVTVEPLDWSQSDDDDFVVAKTATPAPTEKASRTRKGGKATRETRGGKVKSEDLLQSARTALVENRIEDAADIYGGLITKGKLLDEIIDDLDAAALTVPSAKRLHELLGQAHTRKGNIPAALEAYRKAMQ